MSGPGPASEPAFARNRSDVADVRAHLLTCSDGFTPPLAARVSIDDYAAKLVARAERLEAWHGQVLIGLIAVYCDAPEQGEAFITNVSVVPDWARHGIGRRLLEQTVALTRDRQCRQLALCVDRSAEALHLYQALGFTLEKRVDETLHLALALPGRASP